jgi:hypothetical protein
LETALHFVNLLNSRDMGDPERLRLAKRVELAGISGNIKRTLSAAPDQLEKMCFKSLICLCLLHVLWARFGDLGAAA